MIGACRFDLRALEALRGEGPLVIAPNHPGLLGALLVISRLPNVACIMKADIVDNVFLGASARLAGYIRNDAHRSMIKQASAELARGSHLLLFPEGTRTTRWPINPCTAAVALIAGRAQVPIQTLLIETGATVSATHLVLIPSYDPGVLVYAVVRAARRHWSPVWVVVDGSTDGTAVGLQAMAATDPGLRVFVRPKNCGKGAAILHGLDLAARAGFTHARTMDADGQHPVECIRDFMATSMGAPEAMVLGVPRFDGAAPKLRVHGRKVSNGFANLETLWVGVEYSLYGFRVYPIAPLRQVMGRQRWMRRFDFDPEAVVRLSWCGVRPINLPAPVKYLRADQGGVSHFNYLRDNALLTWMHTRLLLGFLLRLPVLLRWRLRPRRPGKSSQSAKSAEEHE